LRDGRTLAWREHGPSDGRPVVHHHGGLVSGRYAATAEAACRALGVRLVTPDRPGVGLSSPRPGRTTADWADDLRQLADHLRLDEFGVLGWSMGGQYAMAAAALLPERVDGLVVVAGAPPLDDEATFAELNTTDRRFTTLARRRPREARALFRTLGLVARRLPAAADRSIARGLSAADAAVVADLPRGTMAAAMAEAMAQPDGMAEEYRAWARPWGFAAGAARCRATVVRGTSDRLIPEGWADRVAGDLGTERVDVPGAGHLFLLTDWSRVLAPLT
jgi:pimeloyl-ACP methyl ester carboxylesterase